MYRVLLGKMKEANVLQKELADYLDISEKCCGQKLNGLSEFTLTQCKKIRAKVAPEMSLDELFKETSDNEVA